MIPVEQALDIVLAHTEALSVEEVALDAALGRVLAEDVSSDIEMPPFARSAMDGYAVRFEDARVAPAVLKVVGQVRAGHVSEHELRPGEALQIMTGAPLPPGADSVQQLEKTRVLGDGRVELMAAVERGQHVAKRGSEIRVGDGVLERGITIDPAAIAVLATAGKARVRVGRRPRVAVLVTGDELVDASERPVAAQIRNSNGPTVLAQARWAGAEADSLGVVPDALERIAEAVGRGLDADVLVVSGGVSEGAYDLVEPAFARFGVEVFFDRVAIKPGAPLVFGRRGRTLVFGLPGNPVSAQVTFDVFVRAALLRMQGAQIVARPVLEVELGGPIRNRSGRKAHVPARLREEAGRLVAQPIRSAGSADVFAHARANALVAVEAWRTEVEAGERAPALLLGNFLERDGT